MPDQEHEPTGRPSRLPDPGTPPPFVPTETAFNRALTRARHRKLTRGLSVALAALAVPAAVLFSLPDRERQDSLQFAVTPTPSASPTAAVQPGISPEPAPDASPVAVASGQTAPRTTRETAAAQTPPEPGQPADPQPNAAPTQGPHTSPRPPSKPAHVESPRESAGRDCGQVQGGGSGFSTGGSGCIRGRAPFTVQRGAPVDLITSFCLSPYRTEPALLEFRGGQEHEILIRQQDRDQDGFVTGRGKILWTWSRTVTFTQGPHTRTLAPDRCLDWTTSWRTQDQTGNTLPAGEYFVEYRMTASDPWGGTMGMTINVAD